MTCEPKPEKKKRKTLSPTQIRNRDRLRWHQRKRRHEIKSCPFYSLCLDVAAYNDDLFVDCKHCGALQADYRPWPLPGFKVALNIIAKLSQEFWDRKFALIMRHNKDYRYFAIDNALRLVKI